MGPEEREQREELFHVAVSETAGIFVRFGLKLLAVMRDNPNVFRVDDLAVKACHEFLAEFGQHPIPSEHPAE